MKARPLLTCSLAALLLAACSKDETPTVDLGLGYFPTNIGHWVEYQVDSMWYDENVPTYGSVSYRVRETLFEDFTDPEGRAAQRIRRAVQDSTGAWHTKDIWWQTRNSYSAERTEENQRRLKLSFPVKAGRFWDLNVYNPGGEFELSYGDLHVPGSVNGMSFDSTITVESTYYNNIIDTLSVQERWAKHVGLVDKVQVISNSQYDAINSVWLTRGWAVRMKAVAYGD